MTAGIACFRIPFPKGMDANDYALEGDPGNASRLGLLIRKAEWLGMVRVKARRADQRPHRVGRGACSPRRAVPTRWSEPSFFSRRTRPRRYRIRARAGVAAARHRRWRRRLPTTRP